MNKLIDRNTQLKLLDRECEEIIKDYKEMEGRKRKYTVDEIAVKNNVSVSTIYRVLRRADLTTTA